MWTRLSIGALAGVVATIPMTIMMLVWHRMLPVEDQYPLPPEQVTDDIVDKVVGPRAFDRRDRRTLAWLLHFFFGAATGSMYVMAADRFSRPTSYTGVGFGLIVWVGSYFGWLPAFDVYGAGRDQTPARNTLMLAVHIAWGVSLGMLARVLTHMRDARQGVSLTAWTGR